MQSEINRMNTGSDNEHPETNREVQDLTETKKIYTTIFQSVCIRGNNIPAKTL
jgi:hypothetical protein